MQHTIHIVDAFTNQQFKGNSAAVILLKEWLDDELMHNIAAENNLSETAFIVKDEQGIFNIRWFSPLTEVDFCGHATLASAFVLFQQEPDSSKVSFYAKAVGRIDVIKNDAGLIEMCFPNRAPVSETFPEQDLTYLTSGLTIKPVNIMRNQQAYFAVYESEADIHALKANSHELAKLAPFDVVVTAPADNDKPYDFVSRYFWPANGGDEDPVTGSIHTGLAPYWAKELGKTTLIAHQASKRGGTLYCRVEGGNVYLSGKAVLYLKGTIYV